MAKVIIILLALPLAVFLMLAFAVNMFFQDAKLNITAGGAYISAAVSLFLIAAIFFW